MMTERIVAENDHEGNKRDLYDSGRSSPSEHNDIRARFDECKAGVEMKSYAFTKSDTSNKSPKPHNVTQGGKAIQIKGTCTADTNKSPRPVLANCATRKSNGPTNRRKVENSQNEKKSLNGKSLPTTSPTQSKLRSGDHLQANDRSEQNRHLAKQTRTESAANEKIEPRPTACDVARLIAVKQGRDQMAKRMESRQLAAQERRKQLEAELKKKRETLVAERNRKQACVLATKQREQSDRYMTKHPKTSGQLKDTVNKDSRQTIKKDKHSNQPVASSRMQDVFSRLAEPKHKSEPHRMHPARLVNPLNQSNNYKVQLHRSNVIKKEIKLSANEVQHSSKKTSNVETKCINKPPYKCIPIRIQRAASCENEADNMPADPTKNAMSQSVCAQATGLKKYEGQTYNDTAPIQNCKIKEIHNTGILDKIDDLPSQNGTRASCDARPSEIQLISNSAHEDSESYQHNSIDEESVLVDLKQNNKDSLSVENGNQEEGCDDGQHIQDDVSNQNDNVHKSVITTEQDDQPAAFEHSMETINDLTTIEQTKKDEQSVPSSEQIFTNEMHCFDHIKEEERLRELRRKKFEGIMNSVRSDGPFALAGQSAVDGVRSSPIGSSTDSISRLLQSDFISPSTSEVVRSYLTRSCHGEIGKICRVGIDSEDIIQESYMPTSSAGDNVTTENNKSELSTTETSIPNVDISLANQCNEQETTLIKPNQDFECRQSDGGVGVENVEEADFKYETGLSVEHSLNEILNAAEMSMSQTTEHSEPPNELDVTEFDSCLEIDEAVSESQAVYNESKETLNVVGNLEEMQKYDDKRPFCTELSDKQDTSDQEVKQTRENDLTREENCEILKVSFVQSNENLNLVIDDLTEKLLSDVESTVNNESENIQINNSENDTSIYEGYCSDAYITMETLDTSMNTTNSSQL